MSAFQHISTSACFRKLIPEAYGRGSQEAQPLCEPSCDTGAALGSTILCTLHKDQGFAVP